MASLIFNIVSGLFVIMALGQLSIQALPQFMRSRELLDSQTAVHTANALRGIAFVLLAHLFARFGGA
jgi:hypothetical protein